MSNIIIFDAEREAGLEEQIRSQASLAYVSQLCPANPAKKGQTLSEELIKDIRATAGDKDGDVYRTFSILVSTSWNKNDDVFSQEEVWAAKQTPTYKPANLEHDEKKIVGGIIGTWPVDEQLKLIDQDISLDNLPDFYHLLVSSVIYNQWQDPEYQARAEDLINKIEDGQMFVSMECIFKGFDYAVVTPDNENHIVARTNDTAFLSRHLRAYGGSGQYEEHKVGRLLKNITFSGKGFVEKPANPDSIIFDSDYSFDFTNASFTKNLFSNDNGVSVRVGNYVFSNTNPQENLDMSNDILNDQVKELKEALAAVEAENKRLTAKVAEANIGKWEDQVAEFKQQVEALSASLSEAGEELSAATTKIEQLETSLATESEARSQAEDLVEKMEQEKSQAERKAQLIEAGLSEEEALAKLEVFGNLSQEQFEAVAETIKEAAGENPFKKKEEEDEEKKAKMKRYAKSDDVEAEADESEETNEEATDAEAVDADEAEVVDEEVLETASVEEAIDMTVASEESEDEVTHVRANLREWVNSYVLNNETGE
jgi:chemotaxis protein histidine kinase CheA|tara:strand:- start:2810 stop:4432 length:1623 start_codon:yes stop_codon:yes gene_type:complete